MKGSKIFVECKCGKQSWVTKYSLINGVTKSCYACGNKKKYKGFNSLSKTYFSKLKRGAEKRKIPFSVDMKQLWDLFIKQNKCCALTGLEIELLWNNSSTKDKQTASLDRVDSSKGYVIENLQWVHKDINKMKNEFKQDYFVQMCSLVVKQKNNE